MTDISEPQAPPRRLTRSSDDRMVAGVCGGLARYTGIDPVIFRVAIAVAVVLGGSGIVAYVLAWIVVPGDGAPESHAESLLRRHSLPRPLAIGVGVVLALVLLAVLGDGPFGDGHRGGGGFGLLVLIGVGVWLVKRDGRGRPDPADRLAPLHGAPVAQAPAQQAAPSSKLPVLILSAMLLTAGLLALLEAADVAEVGLDVGLAILLVVLGAGLLVGAWWGRARWLILLGLPLTAAAALSTAMDVPFAGGAGERVWRPGSAAELDGSYRLGMGEAVLDLTRVELGPGERRVEVSLGMGELTVLLPPGGDVRVDARAGVGELEAPGFADEGADVRHVTVYEASGGGSLDLEVRLGLGRLEVVR